MIKEIFKKNRPDYIREYNELFANEKKVSVSDARFVIFDTETTGLNLLKDRILSIGAISITGNKIDVANSLEVYVDQDKFNVETVKIHGILKNGNLKKFTEEETIEKFIRYIKDGFLVAHHINFDVEIINKALKRMKFPRLRNKLIDTGEIYKMTLDKTSPNQFFSLDELCKIYNISKHDRHTASGDAYITGILFLKIMGQLKKKFPELELEDLYMKTKNVGLL